MTRPTKTETETETMAEAETMAQAKIKTNTVIDAEANTKEVVTNSRTHAHVVMDAKSGHAQP